MNDVEHEPTVEMLCPVTGSFKYSGGDRRNQILGLFFPSSTSTEPHYPVPTCTRLCNIIAYPRWLDSMAGWGDGARHGGRIALYTKCSSGSAKRAVFLSQGKGPLLQALGQGWLLFGSVAPMESRFPVNGGCTLCLM